MKDSISTINMYGQIGTKSFNHQSKDIHSNLWINITSQVLGDKSFNLQIIYMIKSKR